MRVNDRARITEAKCPLCGERVRIKGSPYIHQGVDCHGCDAMLEVISLKPLSLDWPYDDDFFPSYVDEDICQDD